VYELLSGRHPFGRATAVEVFDRGISPDPIESLTGTQNAALLQALKLQRKERTASVRDFRMQVAAAGGPLATWNAIRAARSARQTLVAASAIIAAVVGGYFLRAPRHPPMPGGSMAIPQPLSPLQSVSPPAGLPAQGSTMQPGAAAQMTPLHPGRGLPNPSDYYPVASRRLGEQGTATVKVCVDPHGHLAAPPSIVESSGSSRLDDAALQYATDSSGHWRPATRNGIPITACSNMPIRFQMTDRF